ncbi:MAG: glycine zipper 2TM domain-containing protein [Pseudomonadota bacterium]
MLFKGDTNNSAAPTLAKRLARWSAPVLLIPAVSFAATSYERAPVTGVEPIFETYRYSVPVEVCSEQEVAYREPRHRRASATGPIIGAIIGGALGNAVGHSKRNKQVGTVVGAVLGGSIGADVSRHNRHAHTDEVTYRTEEVCRTDREERAEERLAGYDVTYVYAGNTYTTRMKRDPGDYIRLRVRVTPAG